MLTRHGRGPNLKLRIRLAVHRVSKIDRRIARQSDRLQVGSPIPRVLHNLVDGLHHHRAIEVPGLGAEVLVPGAVAGFG